LQKPRLHAAASVLGGMGMRLIRPSETQLLPNEYRQGDILGGADG
jgi:hypothetical protein